MSKTSKAASTAAATAAAPPPPFRPPPIALSVLLEQAQADSLLPDLVHTAVNRIVHTAIERLYHAGIERAAEQYVAQQAILDALSVVEWQSVERDEGEEKWIAGWEGMTAEDETERLQHLWVPEDEPLPCAIDRWARHVLPVVEAHDTSRSEQHHALGQHAEAQVAASFSDDGTDSGTASVSAPLNSTAPFSVMSVNTSTSTFASPLQHTRSTSVRPNKPHRVLSPSAANRPPPSVTSSSQPAALSTSTHASSSLPYPLPSSSPPAASEQQRLALMAILRQQQADIAERKRKEKERLADDERQREEERLKERALMSARRQKAATLQSARLPAAVDSTTTPARKQPSHSNTTTANQHQQEEKQQLAPSPTSPRSTLPAIRNSTQRPAAQPANAKRATKQVIDESTVDTYTGVAALMASIVRSFVPAAGVRLLYGSEVKAGAEVGGGGGGDGRGRGVSVEDEQWSGVVRGMNRSQYMRWMDDQRAQAAKEADIHTRQHNTFAPSATTTTQPTQPMQHQQHHHHDEADHHSTPLPQQPPHQPPARLRLESTDRNDHEEKVQLTARTAVVLQPRVVTRERRELSFDSRIIADSGWGSNNNSGVAGRNTNARGVGYEKQEQSKSSTMVRERKAVVSVPKHRSMKAAGEQQIVVQQSTSAVKKARPSSAGQVKIVADKSRIAALLQVGKGRENGADVGDGE